MALKRLKEQLRALPRKGLGYGLLRYLNDATAGELAGFGSPQLVFNYLGRFAAGGQADWSAASEGEGLSVADATLPLSHGVALNALTLDGEAGPQLVANWTWAPALLSAADVGELAAGWFGALKALVAHADEAGSGGRSPSDLPLLDLSQAEIEGLERQVAEIEDVLPLTPLQEGLLFHALYDAAAPDVYTVQLDLELTGALDADRLSELRCRPWWRGTQACGRASGMTGCGQPVQVIVPRASVPWRRIDLSMLPEAEREQRLAALLRQDRLERFDLGQAPLLRFALIGLAADRHRLVLSSHHLLMDGWSGPVLVRELLWLYGQGVAMARRCRARCRIGIIWRSLPGMTGRRAAAYWRGALAGLSEGTRLAPAAAAANRAAVAPEQLVLSLGAELSAELSARARGLGVTLNSVLQAVWGVLLGRLSGRSDVVFGVTIAGRPAELAGAEQMVGLFINTLPLRLRLAPGQPLSELMRQAQAAGSELMAHGYLGLSEIQQLAGLDGGLGGSPAELFDTLMVFENYPIDRVGLAAEAAGIRLGRVGGHDATHYPLSLMVQPGQAGSAQGELRLRLDYRPDCFERASVAVLGERLLRLLAGAVAAPDRAIGRLEVLSSSERATIVSVWNDTARAVAACDAARAVCRAGGAHAGCDRGGVRGPAAELRRARRARQPAGASSARARHRPRDRGWALGRALARDADRAASASSRPAPPICRSIPATRRSGWRSCCAMPAPPRW